MPGYEEIIENLNNQIEDSFIGVGDDDKLLELKKIINIHLELLVEFMEYAHNLDISKYIQKNKMTKKVDVASGDYHTNVLPKGYDLVFLSAVIHINSYEENVKLIKKCSSSLNKGGQLVIQDQVMNEERTKPATGALFALNMLVGTEKGDTYTEKEICQWYKKAGLQFEKRIDIPSGNALIVGRKC